MGTIFHGNQPYSGGGVLNIVHKTWEQYQALSSAEKHDASKYYFVPDAPAQGVPGIISELQDEVDEIDSKLTVESDTDHGVVFRKMGNVVCIEGYGVSAVNINATTVPAKFRPSTTQNPVIAPVVFLSTSAGMVLGYIGVATGGSLNLRVAPSYGSKVSSTTNGSAYFTITFIKE